MLVLKIYKHDYFKDAVKASDQNMSEIQFMASYLTISIFLI